MAESCARPELVVKEAQVSGIVDRKVITEKKKSKTQYAFVVFLVWSDGRTTTVWRSYQQFFEFQIQLLMAFPEEAGESGNSERTIPYLPGKKIFTRSDAKLAAAREPQINEYVQKLTFLPEKISHCELVTEFFSAKEGDPAFDDAAMTSYKKKDGVEGETSMNKGFQRLSMQASDDEQDDREDDNVKMKKFNSSDKLLVEQETAVVETVIQVHNPPAAKAEPESTQATSETGTATAANGESSSDIVQPSDVKLEGESEEANNPE